MSESRDDMLKRIDLKMKEREEKLRALSTEDLMKEFFRRWDALGDHKDDDFGEVTEVVEIIRERFP